MGTLNHIDDHTDLNKTQKDSPFPPPCLVFLSPQRIKASAVASRLHYFGTSVAGGSDFTGDGLVDITVGALGRAAVLR